MKPLALASAVGLAALVLPGLAVAGTLQVRDDAHVLTAQDRTALQTVVDSAPFDARLVTTTAYPDPADLSRYVGSLVSEPNMVVVGVDPQGHHVQVHFGRGSHIPRSTWPAIEHAGNAAFHSGEWEGGAATIFREASSSVVAGDVEAPAPTASTSVFGPGVVLLGLLAVAAVAGFVFWRRRSSTIGGSSYGYGSSGYGGYGQGYPPGPPGGYGPGGSPAGGLGPLGGGLIGAGVGGLAGYELGKLAGEREEREREGGFGGSAGSTFDDGAGDSFDAGGGGSDFGGDDGGGGFDGGGDSGGGGADF